MSGLLVFMLEVVKVRAWRLAGWLMLCRTGQDFRGWYVVVSCSGASSGLLGDMEFGL
jgi:hypothetical protein